MPTVRVNASFARGELDPSLRNRADLVDYAMGLATCRNFMVERQGGVANRPGTEFICEVNNSAVGARLIPFVFNSSQTYVLEFGNLYMRVIKNGAQVRESSKAITGISNASPGRVTTGVAHGYATGNEVFISGVLGMTQVNNRNFKVTVIDPTNFDLYEMDGTTPFNTAALPAYVLNGTSERVYQIVTPYTTADLATLDARSQSADIIIIVHPNYAPRELSRSGDTAWTLTAITFEPLVQPPHGGSATVGAAGTLSIKYRVTSRDDATGEESLPAREATRTITNITQANPAVVTTSAPHLYTDDDEVYIAGVVGMTNVNGRKFTINVLTGTTFELLTENSTGYPAYGSGGTVARTYFRIDSASSADANAHQITIPLVTGCTKYYVYRCNATGLGGGAFGFIGTAEVTGHPASNSIIFYDNGRVPNELDSPPFERTLFASAGNFPACGAFYQQRLLLGGMDNAPATIEASRTGQFYNFTTSDPIQDDDAISIPLAGRQVNRIRHIIDIGICVAFTEGGEIILQGDDAGVLTPFDINPRHSSQNGSGDLKPLIINRTAIYQQARGSKIRDLLYDFQSNSYEGIDLSIKSAHLVDGHTIDDWDYQQNPDSIIWAVRDDGILLGLTYVREQEIVGWHHHDTDGEFENVCVVPEGRLDAVYVIVKRTIADPDTGIALTKRYIERFTDRNFLTVKDAVHLDCVLSYDGRNTSTTNTVTIQQQTGWMESDTQLAVFVDVVSANDVGKVIQVTDSSGAYATFEITSTTILPNVFVVQADRDVPLTMRDTSTLLWTLATDNVSGIWHLEGRQVGIFADGFVVASPFNEDVDEFTVTDGALTLPNHYGVIHVGLPYLADIGTLDLDLPDSTLVNKGKNIGYANIWVHETRGLWVGPEAPEDDEIGGEVTEGLDEEKPRSTEGYDLPPALKTEVIEKSIPREWNTSGALFIRIIDPVPARILSVAPSGLIQR